MKPAWSRLVLPDGATVEMRETALAMTAASETEIVRAAMRGYRDPRIPAVRDVTNIAAVIWFYLWGSLLPKRWRMLWSWEAGSVLHSYQIRGESYSVMGQTFYRHRVVLLSYRMMRWPSPTRECQGDILQTVVHELVHVRHPRLPHGDRFERIVSAALRRLWAATEEAADTPEDAR